MSFWRRLRRGFSREVEAIVGAERVFVTDSECLDGGPRDASDLLDEVGRIVRNELEIESVRAFGNDRRWSVSFQARGRTYCREFAARDYGPIFDLVNEALHESKGPRRIHVVFARSAGQEFYVVAATPDEVEDLLHARWNVECAAPHAPHVLAWQGLRFHGECPWRLSDRGSVLEAVLVDRAVIAGVPCAAGASVHFDYDGRLTSAVLAEEVVIQGKRCRAGARVALDDDGAVTGDQDPGAEV